MIKLINILSEAKINKCPAPTQNIELNLQNRQKAINEYGYGPLNPSKPNDKFWQAKVDMWKLDSVKEAFPKKYKQYVVMALYFTPKGNVRAQDGLDDELSSINAKKFMNIVGIK